MEVFEYLFWKEVPSVHSFLFEYEWVKSIGGSYR